MKNKTGIFERLFYNNKLLLIFSLILSIALWATIKINFSDNTTRTISDIKVSIDTSLSEGTDFVPFVDAQDLYVDVKVTGKSYNISSTSLSRSDIIVEANAGYIDSAGYRVLNLTATTTAGSDVSVTNISPSTITVFFDRKATGTYNVEAKLKNDLDTLCEGDYVVGQPVASMSTVNVTGPATVIEGLKKVYFVAEVSKEDLPLTATKEITAEVSYELVRENGSQFLLCSEIETETNPATITIPVSMVKTVDTAVKFVNEPSVYEEQPPKISISPSKVKISYNPLESDEYDKLTVGTIDFRTLDNKINKFDFKLDEKSVANVLDNKDTVYTVTVDMSSLSKKELDKPPAKIVLVNQNEKYQYQVDLGNGGLDSITIIGPAKSLEKISVDDLQVEINVSALNVGTTRPQEIEISNISISNKEVNDCWIFGTYYADITVAEK